MKKLKLKLRIKKLEPVRDRYMFTDNRHPEKGIMSSVLGIISVGALIAAVLFTYRDGGQAQLRYAAAAFVAAIFSVVGFVLGIMSRFEKDIFKLFPNLGIILNFISIVFIIFVVVLGLS
ncbi:MAG: DUF6142 family protein [Butyrivibrio sp.]|nr:DUF6142 family protein [Butyrivibrio sp.]